MCFSVTGVKAYNDAPPRGQAQRSYSQSGPDTSVAGRNAAPKLVNQSGIHNHNRIQRQRSLKNSSDDSIKWSRPHQSSYQLSQDLHDKQVSFRHVFVSTDKDVCWNVRSYLCMFPFVELSCHVLWIFTLKYLLVRVFVYFLVVNVRIPLGLSVLFYRTNFPADNSLIYYFCFPNYYLLWHHSFPNNSLLCHNYFWTIPFCATVSSLLCYHTFH